MTTDTLIAVGRIVRSRGLRGEVVVFPLTDHPEQFEDLEEVVLTSRDGSRSIGKLRFIRQTRRHGKTEIHLEVDGVETREAADDLKGAMISLSAEALALADDEYLLSDLEGMDVVTSTGELAGRVVEVKRMPAQDLIVMESVDGTEILIPDVPEFVDKSALHEGRLIVTPIDGLLTC